MLLDLCVQYDWKYVQRQIFIYDLKLHKHTRHYASKRTFFISVISSAFYRLTLLYNADFWPVQFKTNQIMFSVYMLIICFFFLFLLSKNKIKLLHNINKKYNIYKFVKLNWRFLLLSILATYRLCFGSSSNVRKLPTQTRSKFGQNWLNFWSKLVVCLCT